MSTSALIVHGSVVVAGFVAYTVLTVLGHDGTPVLAAALAYGGGAAGGTLTAKLGSSGGTGGATR